MSLGRGTSPRAIASICCSPRWTSKSTCATAMRLPKFRVSRSVRTMGEAMAGQRAVR